MAQIFHPSTNTLSRVTIFGALGFVGALLWVMYAVNRSPYVTQEDVAREQPIPFSHAHHVGAVGIDCRYCHTSVEESSFAGIPPTKTCINCHSQLWADSPTLEPVRASYRENRPIEWTRVNDLADFVYFDHSIHLHKGVGCVTCHGPVDQMALTWKGQSLQMEWCLECHRNPEKHIRPADKITDMAYVHDEAKALQLMKAEAAKNRPIKPPTHCSACHR